MKLLDVNVLVNAYRRDAAGHDAAFEAVARARRGREPVVILTEVAVGFVRVVTRRGVFADPSTAPEAMAALDAWCSSPVMDVREAGRGRWAVFEGIMSRYSLSGGDVHDGLLAAAALSADATLMTSDRGFLRFEGLVVELLAFA